MRKFLRLWSLLLAVVMVFSVVGSFAFAAGDRPENERMVVGEQVNGGGETRTGVPEIGLLRAWTNTFLLNSSWRSVFTSANGVNAWVKFKPQSDLAPGLGVEVRGINGRGTVVVGPTVVAYGGGGEQSIWMKPTVLVVQAKIVVTDVRGLFATQIGHCTVTV